MAGNVSGEVPETLQPGVSPNGTRFDPWDEVRLLDLYKRGFNPILTAEEHRGYENCPENCDPVADDVADLRWCDALIFVYPTCRPGERA